MIERYAREVFGPMPADKLAAAVRETTFVDLSEAARWRYEEDSQEVFLFHEYPALLPPWPTAWFELKVPKWSRSGQERVDLHPEIIPRLGALTLANEQSEEHGATVLHADDKALAAGWCMPLNCR